jgi:hypothetical protein
LFWPNLFFNKTKQPKVKKKPPPTQNFSYLDSTKNGYFFFRYCFHFYFFFLLFPFFF